MAKWGKKLLARKGSYKLAVAAIARKLTVAIWYPMNGRWTQFEELDAKMSAKLGKIITNVGEKGLVALGKTRTDLRIAACENLQRGRTYILDPTRVYEPKTTAPALAEEPA